mmetsp:Transcript_3492/g.4899  ORF Transcript_3492/g.4899 Transcript_3492/m.4899 type:complete len:328 (-) Transcript_3492:460-1443(-)
MAAQPLEQRMAQQHLQMEAELLGEGFHGVGLSNWQHIPPGKMLLAMDSDQGGGSRMLATNERIHYALDRYEQMGETHELENMMERGLIDSYSPLSTYIESTPQNFSVAHNGRRIVAEQATELLSTLSQRGLPTNRIYQGRGHATYNQHRGGSHANFSQRADHAFFPGLALPSKQYHSHHHGMDDDEEEEDDDDDEDEYDDDPHHGHDHHSAGNTAYIQCHPHHRTAFNYGYPTGTLPLPDTKPISTSSHPFPPTMNPDGSKHYIGAYSPESRRRRIALFHEKRKRRVWTRKVKYDVRKNFADTRMRVKGRFVKKEDEDLLKELINLV